MGSRVHPTKSTALSQLLQGVYFTSVFLAAGGVKRS